MISLGLEEGVTCMCVWFRPLSTGLALALCPNCHAINKEQMSHVTSLMACIQFGN